MQTSEKWIKIKDAAALTQMPERTLRHRLAKGQIVGKKSGISWIVEVASLKNSGFLKFEPPQLESAPVAVVTASTQNSAVFTEKTRHTPRELSPYSGLSAWRKKAAENPLCSVLVPTSIEIQKRLAAGYFEFCHHRKIEIYREARQLISYLWVELDLLMEREASIEQLQRELGEILGSLSGVLKKIESYRSKSVNSIAAMAQ